MKAVGDYILNQSKKMLENKQQAILCAVVLSILPFASWLSVALVSLVTLRKGAKFGFEVLLPAMVVHSVPLMMMVPVDSACVNTLITYLPCYISALVLRKTNSWQIVCGSFLVQALTASLLVQILAPDFIADQFSQFKTILSQYQEYQQIVDLKNGGINSFLLAQLFFSIQILSVVVSAVISLLFARSVQSKLFMPGGFRKELLAFRSGRAALVPLIISASAAYYEIPFAINLLPLTLIYFLLSGFNLAYFILARKRQLRMFTLLVLLILLKPTFVIFAYIILGSLDSIFNFRLYLPARMREST